MTGKLCTTAEYIFSVFPKAARRVLLTLEQKDISQAPLFGYIVCRVIDRHSSLVLTIMAQPYISMALENAFKNQSPKIQQIYSLGNGWEGWAQVEIALALKALDGFYGQKLALQNIDIEQYSEREKASYEGSKKRCDFLITNVDNTNNQLNVSFYELKCMRQNQPLDQFATEVGKDIDKVRGGPLNEWIVNADRVSGWVVAITVGNPNDNSISTTMGNLATAYHIQWWAPYSKSVTPDNFVRVWLWKQDFK
ncbi:hypothetical protein L207DRAFT_605950 [Hyaloscypha variabilis F]|uniref:Uncharacterized protein n=1 Tax=Hyaloscypha variabilis (strain UAMH 11265 / GT02V1 / F) TaxID=1149755 RepID=A0A2J6S853_HYAVF|nr:hypothetical protein L207DRAFT_605950 [Hyaloscypha variabilis F]